MTEPILTIAVPTYNGAKTIRNMLNILLPQVTDEVEVLISDNCSTDETPSIIADYIENYPQIRTIRNEKNVGADGNFLQCMKLAKGKFVMLISDDDIIIENAVEKIVTFLKNNPTVSLAYLESVAFRDQYTGVQNCHNYEFLHKLDKSFTTNSKAEFFECCKRLFGFTSSYVWSTRRIHEIEKPEQYFGTYFLQAYICLCCSNRQDDVLGLVHGPCIAIGEYGIIGNYDMALVEGIYYQKMMDQAIAWGYPSKEFNEWYEWKLCKLCRNSIIKERAINVKKTSPHNILQASRNHPKTWIKIYPFLLLPNWLCRFILSAVRRKQGRTYGTYVNRPTE